MRSELLLNKSERFLDDGHAAGTAEKLYSSYNNMTAVAEGTAERKNAILAANRAFESGFDPGETRIA